MGFWIRNGIIGILLAITAYVLLVSQELINTKPEVKSKETDLTSNKIEAIEQTTKLEKDQDKLKTQPLKQTKSKPKNAAADGLSRFYASINPDFNESGPRILNNVVFLPNPEGDITSILVNKDKNTSPQERHWKGNIESRSFRNGETLFQKLSEYSTREGIEVLWWLNRDFIIKDPFRINKDLISTAQLIGLSVDGHFIDGVKTYFCYSNRTLVLTDTENSYLESSCNKLTNN